MKAPLSPALQNLDALQSLMMSRLQLTGNEWQAATNSFQIIREALTPPPPEAVAVAAPEAQA